MHQLKSCVKGELKENYWPLGQQLDEVNGLQNYFTYYGTSASKEIANGLNAGELATLDNLGK